MRIRSAVVWELSLADLNTAAALSFNSLNLNNCPPQVAFPVEWKSKKNVYNIFWKKNRFISLTVNLQIRIFQQLKLQQHSVGNIPRVLPFLI